MSITTKRFLLKDSVAIVTGGAGGIGSAITKSFVDEGASVVVADFNDKGGINFVEEINSNIKANKAFFIKTDVSNEKSVIKMVEKTLDTFNKIDILVNNAGIVHVSKFLDISLKDWNKMFAVNMTGAFSCCKAVIPVMKEKGYGRIVNISSTSGITGGTSGAHYAAAKAGIIALTKSLSREFAPIGINVNAIAPSKIETPVLFINENGRDALLKKIPVGRFGKPEDIANLAVFLASDLAGYITGEVIVASGGYI